MEPTATKGRLRDDDGSIRALVQSLTEIARRLDSWRVTDKMATANAVPDLAETKTIAVAFAQINELLTDPEATHRHFAAIAGNLRDAADAFDRQREREAT